MAASSSSATDQPGACAPARRARAWISRGLECLQAEQAEAGDPPFDVLIVGSGYGGAVAADRLSARTDAQGRPLRIAVLERGREYLRGAFPDRLADIGGHVRFNLPGAGRAAGQLEGLFDLRLGADMSVLVANGVGGGSLINAGVMLFPPPESFAQPPWPPGLDGTELQARADRLCAELGAGPDGGGGADPFDGGSAPPRRAAMRRIDPQAHRDVPLTIALQAGRRSVAGVELEPCIGCGDCATGCNHGAKISLDLNLLCRARQRGVAIYSGATVSRLRRDGDCWALEVRHTDLSLRRRMAGPLRLRARRVVLAAGTLGSTEILLRSQDAQLRFSPCLGQRFSGNGDLIAALYDGAQRMNAVADDATRPSRRGVGPTITGMLDWRAAAPPDATADATTDHAHRAGGSARRAGGDDAADDACLVQDLAVPGALRRAFEELTATADLLHRLERCDRSTHRDDDAGIDPCAVDPAKVERSTVVAIIGRDRADGTLQLEVPQPGTGLDAGLEIDPGLRIDWPQARHDPRIGACHRRLEAALGAEGSIGGRLLPNPMWRLLPERLTALLDTAPGPLLTVHPLGGCAMGSSRADGVVDDLGRVFDAAAADPQATHDGLVVLDGSIVPCALGVNPALTIAVLADRAIERLCGSADVPGADVPVPVPAPVERPRFVQDTDRPRRRRHARIEVIERLSGPLELQGQRCFVELSLAYRSARVSALGATLRGRELRVLPDPKLSRLRVFEWTPADAEPPVHPLDPQAERVRVRAVTARDDAEALLIAPVLGGTLRLLHREPSRAAQRVLRGLWAWLPNRGLRDLWQALAEQAAGTASGPLRPGERLRQAIALASRAGEVRRFDYALELGRPTRIDPGAHPGLAALAAGPRWRISGHKRLGYARRVSPVAQLMRMRVTAFGGLGLGRPDTLEVSPSYFAQMQQPLVRLRSHPDLPGAYSDLASFGLYLARIVLNSHLWTLRRPDAPPQRVPQRLPGPLPGLPAPRVHTLDTGDGSGARLRLTVYPKPGAQRAPVLMIHGYSASGTTFAHPALPCSLAAYLWQRGAEPWVLDLRSSCGMPTGQQPWAFEDMSGHDIPVALDFVCRATGRSRVDVVSHCMGSAMLAMALLGPPEGARAPWERVRRWVMTQVTPAPVFAPGNLLRAYLMQYALNLLPQLRYDICGAGHAAAPAGPGADAFDRLLGALPYLGEGSDSEFDLENPPWRFWRRTPWVRTRHRLDALFGRVFDARRLAPRTLAHLDDLFGDISLATVSQTIHIARNGFVSNRAGNAEPYRAHLERLAALPMLSLHARDNGLADWEGALRWLDQFGLRTPMPKQLRTLMVERCGHQDLLIGRDAAAVFEHIDAFLRD